MNYRAAEDVARIGRELIEEHHSHLLGVRVEFVYLDKTPKSKGKNVWGRAKKISGLPAFLADENGLRDHYDSENPQEFFVIEISEEVWETLTTKGRRALVDHELSQLDIGFDDNTGEAKLQIVGHDVTEFEAVLKRHGLWNEEVRDFVETGAEQLSLSVSSAGEDSQGSEDLDVSITHNGRTVHTSTANMEKLAGTIEESGVLEEVRS